MKQTHILLAIGVWLLLVSCSNQVFGNPHRVATETRVVRVQKQDPSLRIEPANWWVGMQHNVVELMVHYPNIAAFKPSLDKSAKGVKITKIEQTDNPNYLFITLTISPKGKPGSLGIRFANPATQQSMVYEYPLLARSGQQPAGVNSKDVMYLIFPDRFANGDPSNDNVAGMNQGVQRDSGTARHGGDLQGIINHLDYVQDLGFNTIWLNPELENDQKIESYHGYALTDHYLVDRRLGSNELLRQLIQKCHTRGMKVVRDVVLNHIGNEHWWMKDMPAKDWLNVWPSFTRTTYRAPTLVDPYASEWDKIHFSDGWFVEHMPDLNQRNPHVANYLLQQAIWWIEYAKFDDLRIDTYTYSDQKFCSWWCAELRREYPSLGMFGEIWDHGVSIQGFFADNQPTRAKYDSNLPGVIDFQVMFGLWEALGREQGWTEGINRVYYTLAKDHFYEDPLKNVIMLDNHDFTRFYTTIGENYNKFKSGMAFLMTTRGIPQVYYLTEILGTGKQGPTDGPIRKDFPGGWPGDPVNKFTAAGRSAQENEAYNLTKTLIRYRNTHAVLQTGKLMQFVPDNSVYTYFRYNDNDNPVMVILNTANSERTIQTDRFEERMKGYTTAIDVTSGNRISNLSTLIIPANSPLVLELQR